MSFHAVFKLVHVCIYNRLENIRLSYSSNHV
jgi:hypothetical protein